MRFQFRRVVITAVIALAMAACDGGSSSPPAPTVTLTSAETDIGDPSPTGRDITLTWASTHATSCAASGQWSGSLGASGSQAVPVHATSTYSISCSGRGGVATASVTVTVWYAPHVSITADRTLVLPNTAVLLTWSAPDAKTCRGVAGLSGTLPTSGSQTSAPLTETTAFAIECSNPGGLAADATVVTVMKFTALELPLDRAVDLNDHGEVLGYRTSVGDRLEPVVWLAGGSSIVVLGCSDPVPYYCHSHYPVAMNSNPTVVGRQYSLSGMTWEGFRWYVADTVVHPVPISFPGNIADINDAGQIVGGGPGPGATLISDGTRVLLFGSNGSNSMASAINNAGHVTGYVVPGADGIRHVFLYADGTTQDLGTMDGASSDAQDINLADEIVGFATFPAGSRAFRYSSSSFTDLGSLGGASSAALRINDAGQIVGWSSLAGEVPQTSHAFLYVNDTMYDLNELVETLPVRLSGASKINNRGQILAYGCVPPADDDCRYYLLTPVWPF